MTFKVNTGNNIQVQWGGWQVMDKLSALARANKKNVWIKKDLSVESKSLFSRIFWAVAKHFKWLRDFFCRRYEIDLEQTKELLHRLRPWVRERSQHSDLQGVFQKAVHNFNKMVPHHHADVRSLNTVIAAINGNDLDRLKEIINSSNVGIRDDEGRAPLHLAVMHDRKDMVEFLLGAGGTVQAEDAQGKTPLHHAKSEGVAKLLIDKKADVNALDHEKRSPLCDVEDIEVLEALVNARAEVNPNTKLPLSYAKGIEKARFLLEKGADPKAYDCLGLTPLHYVEDPAVAALFLEKGADVNARQNVLGVEFPGDMGYGATPLHYAKNREIAQLLIDHEATVNVETHADGWRRSQRLTPLHAAAENNRLDVVEVLLDNGAEIEAARNSSVSSPLYMASDAAVKIALISRGADINSRHFLFKETDEDVVRAVLETGRADLEIKDLGGRTPLIAQCPAIQRILIEAGADVEAEDNNGYTALHHAKDVEVAQLLIDNGANPNATNHRSGLYGNDPDFGMTPLHCVENTEVIRYLVTNGANINAQTFLGKTPLHVACEQGRDEVVAVLLELGADTTLKTTPQGEEPGKTAFEMVPERHTRVRRLVWEASRSQPNAAVLPQPEAVDTDE